MNLRLRFPVGLRPRASLQEGHGVRVGGNSCVERVCDVGQPAINWSLACCCSLSVEAEHGHHSQPSVLDLLELEFCGLGRVLGHAHWIKDSSWIAILTTALQHTLHTSKGARGTLRLRVDKVHVPLCLRKSHSNRLDDNEGAEVEVNLCASLEPHRHIQDADLGQELRDKDTSCTQHGEAGVHKLGLHVPLKRLGLLSKAERVEAEVTDESAIQVCGVGGTGHPACALGDHLESGSPDGSTSGLRPDGSLHEAGLREPCGGAGSEHGCFV
mmetsp:Transcript_35679/g.43014  ORF Transcript_35679/g.43014 Transcript_35679/m.43014 type:complete len:270 (+) Transcript_35679:117-926(+)